MKTEKSVLVEFPDGSRHWRVPEPPHFLIRFKNYFYEVSLKEDGLWRLTEKGIKFFYQNNPTAFKST